MFCAIGETLLGGITFSVGKPFFIPMNGDRLHAVPTHEFVVGSKITAVVFESSVKSPPRISVVGVVNVFGLIPLRPWYLSYVTKKKPFLLVRGIGPPTDATNSFWCSTGFFAGIVFPFASCWVSAGAVKPQVSKIVLRTKSATVP